MSRLKKELHEDVTQESLGPEERYVSPDESTGHESRIPIQKRVSFCGDGENFPHESRKSLKIDIYASAGSPIIKQGQVQPDETQLTVTALPCEEDLTAEQNLQEDVEEENAALYENFISSETLHCETKG